MSMYILFWKVLSKSIIKLQFFEYGYSQLCKFSVFSHKKGTLKYHPNEKY